MIIEFLTANYDAIVLKLLVVSIAWGLVFLAMIIDFYFGIKKAKKQNEIRSSEGYKRSVEKFSLYFASLFFALIFDALIPISYFVKFPLSAIPFITIFMALALVLTEFKSVREKGEDKVRRNIDVSSKQIIEALKNKEEIFLRLLEKYEKQPIDENNNTTSD